VLKGRHSSTGRWAIQLDGPRFVLRKWIAALVAAVLLVASASAAPPGALISNTASLEYTDVSGRPASLDSNPVELTVAVVRTPANLELMRITAAGNGVYQQPVGPSACRQGDVFVDYGDAILPGIGAIDPSVSQDVAPSSSYNLGEPLFLRLDDPDQNVDYQVVDTATITVVHDDTSDQETIRLTETGLDTGIFVGFVPTSSAPPVPGDCVLEGVQGSSVRVTYTDPADAADSAEAGAILDPVSRAFGSEDGVSVDEVTIQLVDAVSGAPATVYGNDGVSLFPSTITTGSTVTDSSGASYTFGSGEFRFPVVPDGDYRFVVTPPTGFAFPSNQTEQDLQALPGAPYTLGPASFGAPFTISGGEPFAWDLPVDPRSTALFLQKRTRTTTAAAGDFVRYELLLENASGAGPATELAVTDELPTGMRFVEGSASVDGADIPDPTISPDGRSLEFRLADLPAGGRTSIAYVAEIVRGSPGEELVNRAFAEASAMIRLREDLFRSTGTIIGRVVEGECGETPPAEEQGVANVRVYLEDGRYAVTDEGGRFHFEGLAPGTHVAQLDTFTVPDYFNIVSCREATGFAGAADSQFVKLHPGSLLRADFYLRRKPRPEGRIDLELRNLEADSAEQADFELDLRGTGNVAISNIDVRVLLPDGVAYVPGSMRVDGQDLGDPRVYDTMLSMSLDDRQGNWSSRVSFRADIGPQVSGELVTKALANFDSPMAARQETPVA
jgi:uncharacterized repeat protein (TIGR01451 family)